MKTPKNEEKYKSNFRTIANVSALGEIFGKTEKEKNDWKLRMIKAGLGEGFIIPDDWDQLTEKDKGNRLDNIIKFLKDTK